MTPTLSPEDRLAAAQWLAYGNTGKSSEFLLATAIAGAPLDDNPEKWRYPHDAYDLVRCFALVDAAPGVRETAFPVLRASSRWAPLIRGWDDLKTIHASVASWPQEERWERVTFKMRDLWRGHETL